MKIRKTFLLTVILLLNFCLPVMANSTSEIEVVEVFDDGSYIESSITDENTLIELFSSNRTKSGDKTYTYKSKSGKVSWSITVRGTFTYNGISAKCTASSVSTTCPSSNWKMSDKDASKSGATAKATASFKYYTDDKYVKTVNKIVKLTCSKSGKLS